MQQPSLQPSDLTQQELVEVVSGLIEILWPGGDADHEWEGADTLQDIASILESYNLAPY